MPNYDLEPENAINYELAYQWKNAQGHVRATIFNSEYSDFIDNVTYSRELPEPVSKRVYNRACNCYQMELVSTDDYQRPENIGKASIKGMELDAQYRFTNGIELRGAYSHSKGEYENNDPMLSVSPDSALVSLGYDSRTFWRAITQVRYQAAKKQEDATVKNAYGQVVPATDFLSNSATVVDLIANFDVTDTIYINLGGAQYI